MSAFTTLEHVYHWHQQLANSGQHDMVPAPAAAEALSVVMAALHKKQSPPRSGRKLSKTEPLRVNQDLFKRISDKPALALPMVDDEGRYAPGMLLLVSEFDVLNERYTQRQCLRVVTHVWQGLPGRDSDQVIVRLCTPEELR